MHLCKSRCPGRWSSRCARRSTRPASSEKSSAPQAGMSFEELSFFLPSLLYTQKRPIPILTCRKSERARFRGPSLVSSHLSCCGWLFRLGALESHGVLLAVAIHADAIARQDLPLQNLERQRILNQSLNRSPQRPRPVSRVVPLG